MAHFSFLPPALASYTLENWLHEPDILRRLRVETSALPNAGMQITSDQGQLMALLAKIAGVKRYLEIGVFTGYSSLAMAMALPEDGEVVALDVSEEFTSVARRYWEEAGVSEKIALHLAPAVETLDWLLAEGNEETFDMAFIDADKPNYLAYYERVLQLVKANGVILVDNVFWNGRVADPENNEENTKFIREVNSTLYQDERIELAIIPIGDGLTVARKR